MPLLRCAKKYDKRGPDGTPSNGDMIKHAPLHGPV